MRVRFQHKILQADSLQKELQSKARREKEVSVLREAVKGEVLLHSLQEEVCGKGYDQRHIQAADACRVREDSESARHELWICRSERIVQEG